jgi:hypothetical protein
MPFSPCSPCPAPDRPEIVVVSACDQSDLWPSANGGPPDHPTTYFRERITGRGNGGQMNPEWERDVNQMVLPPFLERTVGTIRVSGHRVSLYHVLDAIFDRVSIDRMREMFPTIPPRKLWEVVAFCNSNIESMRRYHSEQMSAFLATTSGRIKEGPSFAELRRRRDKMQQPG